MLTVVIHSDGYRAVYQNGQQHGAFCDYHAGLFQPNHPVPACIGPTTFGRISILTWPADERADNPVAEYWNEKHVTGIFRSAINK
jgi:hypothetical protein